MSDRVTKWVLVGSFVWGIIHWVTQTGQGDPSTPLFTITAVMAIFFGGYLLLRATVLKIKSLGAE